VSPSQVYVSGFVEDSPASRSAVWCYNGCRWSEIRSWNQVELQGIFGLSSQSIWVAGILQPQTRRGALVLHWNGERWEETLSDPSSPGLLKIWARNDHDVYAVGYSGAIFHFNGVRWQRETPPNGTGDIRDVFGRVKPDGTEEIYAATAVGTTGSAVLRRTASQWEIFFIPTTSGDYFRSLWVAADGTIYAIELISTGSVGGGILYVFDGTNWKSADWSLLSGYLATVRGDKTNRVYVVGEGVLRLDGGSWSRFTASPQVPDWMLLSDVWSSGTSVFMIVGYLSFGAVLVTDFSTAEPH
jgi:hypothetical protein